MASSGGRTGKPGTSGATQRSISITTTAPLASPLISTPKDIAPTPETARAYLATQNIIPKDEPLTIHSLLKAINTLAETKHLDGGSLRLRLNVLASAFNHSLVQTIAESTMQFLGERMESLKKDAIKEVENNMSTVRKTLEEERIRLEKERKWLEEERKVWLETTGAVAASKESRRIEEGSMQTKLDEFASTLTQKLDSLNQKIDDKFATSQRGPWENPARGDMGGPLAPAPYGHPAFTSATSQDPQLSPPRYPMRGAPLPPAQILDPEFNRLRGSEEKRDRQLLLDPAEDTNRKNLASLLAREIEGGVNNAIDDLIANLPTGQLAGKPMYIKCLRVIQQVKGGVILNMNTPESKDWLTRPVICAEFLQRLPFAAKIIPRKYKIVVQNLSTATNLADEDLLSRIEYENRLTPGDLHGITWIRKKHSENQRVAFAVLECRTKYAANHFLGGHGRIEANAVDTVKYMSDALRCFNCQKPGHRAATCSDTVVCGTCGEAHITNACTNRDRQHHFCSTCQEKGHATRNRTCPNFFTKNLSNSSQGADMKYKFFITNEEWTWAPVSRHPRGPPSRPGNLGDVFRDARPRSPVECSPTPRAPAARDPVPHLRPENLARPSETPITRASSLAPPPFSPTYPALPRSPSPIPTEVSVVLPSAIPAPPSPSPSPADFGSLMSSLMPNISKTMNFAVVS